MSGGAECFESLLRLFETPLLLPDSASYGDLFGAYFNNGALKLRNEVLRFASVGSNSRFTLYYTIACSGGPLLPIILLRIPSRANPLFFNRVKSPSGSHTQNRKWPCIL